MRLAIRPAAGLLAATLLAAGCGPSRSSGTPPRLETIPALASGEGASASMGLAEPAYPVPARVEYRVQGTLPALPSAAAAYRLGEVTGTQAVSRLASAFGVSGAVSSDAQGWTVTGGASTLRVERAPGLPWQLAQSGGGVAIGYSGCAVAVPGRVAGPPGAASAPPTVSPATPPPCVQPTPVPGLPARTLAEQGAEAALRAAGLDLTGATVEASGGIGDWYVSVTPSVGGTPLTGSRWSVTVGPHGAIVSASGWLAAPVSAGDYPLVGVQAGLDRLRAGGRWILRGGPGPMPLLGTAAGGTNAGSSAGSAPPAGAAPPQQVAPAAPASPVAPVPLPTRGAPVPPSSAPAPLPVTVVTVTGVHLGLAWGTPVSGAGVAWLVPVYVFELAGGGTVPVIAVADGLIATPAPVTPGVKILPAPAPAEPPGAPTAPNR